MPSETSIKTVANESVNHIINIGIDSTPYNRGTTRKRRIKSIPTITCHIQRYDTEVQLSFD